MHQFLEHEPRGQATEVLKVSEMGKMSVRELPDVYTVIDRNIKLSPEDMFQLPAIPMPYSQPVDVPFPVAILLEEQYRWLKDVKPLLCREQLGHC